jgi:hypothetical protein
MTLDQLWKEATMYGRPTLYQSTCGKYSCYIVFNTIKHVELKASHPSYLDTPEEALSAAIKVAKEIVESTMTMGEKIKQHLRIGRT